MSEPVDVSVVVCTFNRAESLDLILGDLVRQRTDESFTFELVVVDDASTDQTQTVIDRHCSDAKVRIRSVRSNGSGVAAARNRGIESATGGWIAFTDDDQRVPVNWLSELLLTAIREGAEFAGGPIVLDLPMGSRLGPACRSIYGEHPRVRFLWPTELLPPGGNRLMKVAVLDRIGAHDELIRTGGEDLDILKRAVAAGVRFAWAPDAVVYHVIPRERLDPGRIRAYCWQAGLAAARIDFKHRGLVGLLGSGSARSLKVLVLTSLLWPWAILTDSTTQRLDCKARLWLTAGYWRGISEHMGSTVAGERTDPDLSFRRLRF